MAGALAPLVEAYQDRAGHAREAHARGARVVGYLCDNVPVELIRAAGFIPYRLSGDTKRSREEIADLVTPVHARRFAGNEFVEAIYATLASGELDFLDYLVVPHNRKAVLAMLQSIELLRAAKPGFRVPEGYCLDRSYARNFLTSGFNQASLHRFAAALGKWRGPPITDDELRQGIAEGARCRSLLREVNALRTSEAPRITGSEALHVYGASHFMAPAKFEKAASAFLEEARARGVLPGLRIYVGGSPLDHPQFYELVESLGAVVVAEDQCWGARCADLDVAADCAPLDALARRFDRQPACSLLGSLDAVTDAVVARMTASGAEAAIFTVTRGDLAQMWETPSQVDALRARGIPCLHLGRQPYNLGDTSKVADEIAAFLSEVRNNG